MTTRRAQSSEEMVSLGRALAPSLIGKTVCFNGDLGAGKTTLIKGIISQLTQTPIDGITSPTFNIMNTYSDLYHFDCYRLEGSGEFLARGLDEPLYSGELCLIEWPEKIENLIPKDAIRIDITTTDAGTREVTIHEPQL